MAASIYADKFKEPNEQMLKNDLGPSKALLDRISALIGDAYGNYRPEWKFYGKKSGWILKMLSKKRNVLFIIPCKGHFKVAFTFGDKAVALIDKSKLPELIKTSVANARKYVEGRTIQLMVSSEDHLEHLFELIKIKMTPV